VGTCVLGLAVEASDEEEAPGLPQLFQLSQEGADHPLAVERQPLAAPIVKHTVKAPKVVHRENATRMASDPSLIRGNQLPRKFHSFGFCCSTAGAESRRNDEPSYLLSSAAARSFNLIRKDCRKVAYGPAQQTFPRSLSRLQRGGMLGGAKVSVNAILCIAMGR